MMDDRQNRSAIAAAAVVALTLVAGAAAGIVVYRMVSPAPVAEAPAADMSRTLDHLSLTPEQRSRADSILARTAPRTESIMVDVGDRLVAVADSAVKELNAILDERQRARLDSLRVESGIMLKRKVTDPEGGTTVDTIYPPRRGAPRVGTARLGARPPTTSLRDEVESLFDSMVRALREDPKSVAAFYTDDAVIAGGGGRWTGRTEIDRYWREATNFADWRLEVIDVGGEADRPWVQGRSTLRPRTGEPMVTEFVGLLERGQEGRLRFRVDMYVAAR
jgi:hypothetical protein